MPQEILTPATFTLDNFVKEEVFLIGEVDGSISDCTFGEVFIANSQEDMLSHVASLVPGVDSDVTLLHGVITEAYSLPEDLKGLTAHILATDLQAGITVVEIGDDIDDLSTAIEELVSGSGGDYEPMDIDDIYVMYGYEVNLHMSMDEEGIDEELLGRCVSLIENGNLPQVKTTQEVGYD